MRPKWLSSNLLSSHTSPLIEVRNLTHIYNAGTPDAVVALRGIDLTINRGEFIAIVGGNGSGKSTLAKHFNALLQPTEGEVIVDGLNTHDRDTLWDIRQRVGMVFQNPDNQLVATVVEEDVAFGPENLGLPPQEIRRRVDEALAAVDMSEHRRREPHLLSGGQKQRVAVAGILAMRPQCLVLDEATTMLDPQGQREVLETIRRLNTQGVTVIHITHDMDEAAFFQRVIALADGRVALDGPPEKVFRSGDELNRIRLALPPVPVLAERLRQDGLPLSSSILTVEQLEDALAQLAKGRLEPLERVDGTH
jgi:energy-coupling factor transport system ATP-binding protein